MLNGYAGYYLKGKIANGEEFSYKLLPRSYQFYNALKGIEGVTDLLRLEVMGDVNPFKRAQMITVANGQEYSVLEVSDTLFSQNRNDLIITLVVGRN
ncbi:MAG: hypothetical protein RR458_01210 [Clostridia bacterium]